MLKTRSSTGRAASLHVATRSAVAICASLAFAFLVYRSVFSNERKGSSGSRTHTIRYCKLPNGNMFLEEDDFFEVRPGVSSYKDDLPAVSRSLKPLFDHSKSLIPKASHQSTPIIVKATAGLRLLSDTVAEAILDEIRNYIEKELPFMFKREWCSLITGKEEGAYAWMTINFALQNLGKDAAETAGILDLGGASTQIVFAHEGNWEHFDEDSRFDFEYHGRKYSLFVHSFLGYGIFEAKRAIYHLSSSKKPSQAKDQVSQPCLPEGVMEERTLKSSSKAITFQGAGDYDTCLSHIRALVDAVSPHEGNFANSRDNCEAKLEHYICSMGGKKVPKTNAHFYAFSHYFDRTAAIGFEGVDTVREMDDLAHEYCSLTIETIRAKIPQKLKSPEKPGMDVREELCFDYLYMSYLWKEGFGFLAEEERITVAEKVNNAEASWALGAFLYEGAREGLI